MQYYIIIIVIIIIIIIITFVVIILIIVIIPIVIFIIPNHNCQYPWQEAMGGCSSKPPTDCGRTHQHHTRT